MCRPRGPPREGGSPSEGGAAGWTPRASPSPQVSPAPFLAPMSPLSCCLPSGPHHPAPPNAPAPPCCRRSASILSGPFFSRVSAWLAVSFHSGLCSDVTSLVHTGWSAVCPPHARSRQLECQAGPLPGSPMPQHQGWCPAPLEAAGFLRGVSPRGAPLGGAELPPGSACLLCLSPAGQQRPGARPVVLPPESHVRHRALSLCS